MLASATLEPGLRTVIRGTNDSLDRLNRLLALAWERSSFHRTKWKAAGLSPGALRSVEDLRRFPFTTREELERDQAHHPPLGTCLTVPFTDCLRLLRSSGTTRAPLFWADDAESWGSVVRASQALWEMGGVTRADRIFLTTPFGASSGPWIMHAGASQLGCLNFSLGRATLSEQLSLIRRFTPTVLASKPRDLLALALAAETAGLEPAAFGVRRLICGGAPGAHQTETRRELERRWGAECFDRYGMTEVGSIAGECSAHCGGMHVLESELIAEVVDADSGQPPADGSTGELVLTHLGRTTCPIVRYRTGDQVRLDRLSRCACGHSGAILVGGVLSRTQPAPA